MIKQPWSNICLTLLADEKSLLESQAEIAKKMVEVLPKTNLKVAAVNNLGNLPTKATPINSNIVAKKAASSSNTLAGGEAQLLTSVCAALSGYCWG